MTSQKEQHEAGISTTSSRRWNINNINKKLEIFSTKLEIFSMRLESQQHQHEAGNIQQKFGITSTSTRSWKYLARGWHQHLVVL
jgi:hypothetical protein